jgi:hypothetical protein
MITYHTIPHFAIPPLHCTDCTILYRTSATILQGLYESAHHAAHCLSDEQTDHLLLERVQLKPLCQHLEGGEDGMRERIGCEEERKETMVGKDRRGVENQIRRRK